MLKKFLKKFFMLVSQVGHEISSGIYVVWFRILNVHSVYRQVGLMKILKNAGSLSRR